MCTVHFLFLQSFFFVSHPWTSTGYVAIASSREVLDLKPWWEAPPSTYFVILACFVSSKRTSGHLKNQNDSSGRSFLASYWVCDSFKRIQTSKGSLCGMWGSTRGSHGPMCWRPGISSVCISAIPHLDVRKIQKFQVFIFTCSASVLAYLSLGFSFRFFFGATWCHWILRWMLVVLSGITPNRVDVWEGRNQQFASQKKQRHWHHKM